MNDIKSMAELEEEYIRHVAELNRVCRIDNGYIILKIGEVDAYEIEISRCDTCEKIVWWVYQLSEKDWMTLAVLRHFIDLACSYHGLKEVSNT